MSDEIYVHPTAEVDPAADIGSGTSIWNWTKVREGARIGPGCTIGQNVYVDHDVVIGRVLDVERHQTPDGSWRRPMVFFRSRFGINEPDAPVAPDPWGTGDRWGWG